MKKILFLIFIFNLFHNHSFAQNTKIDSLYTIYNNKNYHDTIRLNAIQTISKSLVGNDFDSAIVTAKSELQFAQKSKQKIYEAEALSIMGLSYKHKGDYVKAIEYYLKAIKAYEDTGNKKDLGVCYNNIGLVFASQSNYPKALEYFFKGLKTAEENSDKNGVGNCYNSIGLIYGVQSNHPKALEYFSKSLKISEELKNKKDIASSLTSIGNVYIEQSNYPKALEYYLKSLKIYEVLNNQQGVGLTYTIIGDVYNEKSEYSKALEYYLKSIKILNKTGNKKSTANCYISISDLYNNISDYKKAILYCDSALQITKETGDIDIDRFAYRNLSTANAQLSNYKAAYENHVKFKLLTDSIFNTNNNNTIGDLKTNFEVEKKENEMKSEQEKKDALSKEELKRQTFQLNAFIGGFVMMLILASISYRNFRRKKKDNLVITEQKNLVERQNQEIKDSIQYALRIQTAILPAQKIVKQYLENSFILYKPKDIVAGDFYWMESIGDVVLFAACDCTGHGVPGAMVSVVCHNSLNRAVREFGLSQPAAILDKTAQIVLENFSKSEEEIHDGMDISICAYNTKTKTLEWAGANNSLLLFEIGKLTETKADKQCIGYNDNIKPFTNHQFNLKQATSIYLFTDGFADQFGGQPERKLTKSKFKELLVSIQHLPIQQQGTALDEFISNYKKETEQTDDILVIGVRV
jgi:tetratricopeptide (TPR) repeat protein/serine phosphatase RsbU (regulator of sigma subunit)